jgi:hypothetical protein
MSDYYELHSVRQGLGICMNCIFVLGSGDLDGRELNFQALQGRKLPFVPYVLGIV